jgi:hypothetical protein
MTTGTVTCVPSGGLAGAHSFAQGTANTPPNNSVGFQAPTNVPAAYLVTMPGAPAAGYVKRTGANPSVESVGAIAGADLPSPSASTLGGVKSKACNSGDFVSTVGTDGSIACTTPTGGPGGGETLASLATAVHRSDDFLTSPGGATTVGRGEWGWMSDSAGAFTRTTSTAGHPGQVLLDSTATAGYHYMSPEYDSASAFGSGLPSETFNLVFVAYTTISDANTLYRCGLGGRPDQNPGTEGIWIEKLPADTSWFGVTRTVSAQTRSTALSAEAQGSWYVLNMYRKDASTIGFKVATTIAGLSSATEQTNTTNIPTAEIKMFCGISNNSTAASKQLAIDLVTWDLTGMGAR